MLDVDVWPAALVAELLMELRQALPHHPEPVLERQPEPGILIVFEPCLNRISPIPDPSGVVQE
jgi:hypothetical protein